jgi:hypothetical protein
MKIKNLGNPVRNKLFSSVNNLIYYSIGVKLYKDKTRNIWDFGYESVRKPIDNSINIRI